MSCFTVIYLVIKCHVLLIYINHLFAKNNGCPSFSSLTQSSVIVYTFIPVNVCTKECFFLCLILHTNGWLLYNFITQAGWLPLFKSSVVPVSQSDSLLSYEKAFSCINMIFHSFSHPTFCSTLSSFPFKLSPEKKKYLWFTHTWFSCKDNMSFRRIWYTYLFPLFKELRKTLCFGISLQIYYYTEHVIDDQWVLVLWVS